MLKKFVRFYNSFIYKSHFIKTFLYKQGIVFTESSLRKVYEIHPHKNNFWGISCTLQAYGIKTIGVKINNKKEILQTVTPCIARFGNSFITITKINNNSIHYVWNNKEVSLDVEEFVKTFDGNILIPKKNENNIEENLLNNFIQDIYSFLDITFLFITIIIAFIYNAFFKDIYIYGNIILNIVGVILCLFIIQKHLHKENSFSDKVCGFFKNTNCGDIVNSSASKLYGFIDLGSLGLTYFYTNVTLLSIVPTAIGLYVILNILCLPFSCWSIWYQKNKAHQWCSLCVMVQIVVFLCFIINILKLYNSPYYFNFSLYWFLLYVGFFLSIKSIIDYRLLKQENINHIYNFSKFKCQKSLFLYLLYKGNEHRLYREASNIIFGNPESEYFVTIFSNPHCSPCADLHLQIEDILRTNWNEICIQYIFIPFSSELEEHNKWLIAIYQENGNRKAFKIFSEWYSKGKNNTNNFYKKFRPQIEKKEVLIECEKHIQWREKEKMAATPTILVNGYELPNGYTIKDIINI